jgi:hypothetical protein
VTIPPILSVVNPINNIGFATEPILIFFAKPNANCSYEVPSASEPFK